LRYLASLLSQRAFVGMTLIIAGAFVILIPPFFSIWIGHIIGVRYSQLDETPQKGKRHPALPALVMVFLILVIQISLVTFLFLAGESMWG
jgi:hypothetical protein